MRKDRLISFRVPEPVFAEVNAIAEKQGVTVTQLMKDFLVSASWRLELERNRTYHREVLKELDLVEKRVTRIRIKTLESNATKATKGHKPKP